MLSEQEKQEMLADAKSAKRRNAFRKMRVADSEYSLDSYLKFLDSVHKVFSKIPSSLKNPSASNFKL